MTRIETERLVLRSWTPADADALQGLVSAKEIADGMVSIPHPYPERGAAEWIASVAADGRPRFAIERREDSVLVGSIGLTLDAQHSRAEVGYFVGVEHWGRGYATEALRAMLAFGFDELGVDRIFAHHFLRNPASGRVLRKAGMRLEGTRRSHALKDGVFLDSDVYALLRSEHEQRPR